MITPANLILYYGDDLLVECPAGSGITMNLAQVADELAKRVVSLFEKDVEGTRKIYGKHNWFYQKPGNEHLVLFYEYYNGDTAQGLGASHQTGWSSLIASLLANKVVVSK